MTSIEPRGHPVRKALGRLGRQGGLTLKAKVLGVTFFLVTGTIGIGQLTALGGAPAVAQTPVSIVTSSTNFMVLTAPPPTITKFNPMIGFVGTTVVITGTGFTGATAVAFHGTNQPTYTVDSDTQITTTVPIGATKGPIRVTTPGGSVPSSKFFTVGPPHIMVIVMENAAYSHTQGSPYVIGNASAPYINGTLVPNYTSATHWFAVEHNSPRDYLDLISGWNQKLGLGGKRPFTKPTLVDELNSATPKIPWRGYMESMPSNCYAGSGVGLYDPIHNPFVFFKNYASYCTNGNGGVFPYNEPFNSSQLKTDLNSATPPDFFWFSPNVCNDMHTAGGACGSNPVANGDTWLSTFIPEIQATTWYTSGGIIIVTWDESANSDNSGGTFGNGGQVATLVISSHPIGSYTTSGDHYATLRAIEEEYGVGLLINSANASFGDLKTAF